MKTLTEEELIRLTKGMTAISLGWGVQSWAMVAMVCLGDLPLPDLAIHSDTTWERSTTYHFSEFWGEYVKDCGVDYRIASDPNYAKRVTDPEKGLYIPAFTLTEAEEYDVVVLPDGDEIEFSHLDDEYYDGTSPLPEDWKVETRRRGEGKSKKGQLMRSCTDKWKIAPLRRLIAHELQVRGKKKTPESVTVWLGISLDEFVRAKHSPVKYIVHQWPLLDLKMTRQDCEQYLRTEFVDRGGLEYATDTLPSHTGVKADTIRTYLTNLKTRRIQYDYLNLVVPGKSSCTFCPFHSSSVWMDMRREYALNFENRINAIVSQCPELESKKPELYSLAEFMVGDLKHDWTEALEVDEAVRDKRPGFKTFVSDQRIPLKEIATDNNYNPEDDASCDSGYCFM